MKRKKVIIGLITLAIIICFYFLPTPIFGCTEITSINSASFGYKYNIEDRLNDCKETDNGGYNSLSKCMYVFQRYTHKSMWDTHFVCTSKGLLMY